MTHVQYLISTKDKSIFWIKPLWCPIGRPFCIVRWNTKRGINICPFYCGVRRETDGAMCVWCKYDEVSKPTTGTYTYSFKLSVGKYDEVSKSNIATQVPENCPTCTHYLGDICITKGELRDPCADFMDVITWLETKSLSHKGEDS